MEAYRHQVGGHSQLMKPQDSSKVYKPFTESEFRFYDKLSNLGATATDSGPLHVLKQFVPKYFGVTEVQVQTTCLPPTHFSPSHFSPPAGTCPTFNHAAAVNGPRQLLANRSKTIGSTPKQCAYSRFASTEDVPTSVPNSDPTSDPTSVPINVPINVPTSVPTSDPTNVPSGVPTGLTTVEHCCSGKPSTTRSVSELDSPTSTDNNKRADGSSNTAATTLETRSQRKNEQQEVEARNNVITHTPAVNGDLEQPQQPQQLQQQTSTSSSSLSLLSSASSCTTVLKYIVLEDLVYQYKKPCVMDLKMGKRQRKIGASSEKKQRQLEKSLKTTSHEVGFRLCGMQFYDKKNDLLCYRDKYWGRKLTKDTLRESIGQWFWDGDVSYHELLLPLMSSLKILHSCISKLRHYRFWSSSLLWVFDGGVTDANARLGSLDVRMIDFANTIVLKDNPGPDEEYLFGLGNLISILESLVSTSVLRKNYGNAFQTKLPSRPSSAQLALERGGDSSDSLSLLDDEEEEKRPSRERVPVAEVDRAHNIINVDKKLFRYTLG